MPTIGDLIIAVKTSGVSEAKKQLMDLDKLAKSIGDVNTKAAKSAKDAGGSAMNPGGDDVASYRAMFEARAKMALDFYSADVSAHAKSLRFMVEQERAAWANIKKIREGAASGFSTGGVLPPPGGGAIVPTGGTGPSPGGRDETSTGFMGSLRSAVLRAFVLSQASRMADETAKAFADASVIGTEASFANAVKQIPIFGDMFSAGQTARRLITKDVIKNAASLNPIGLGLRVFAPDYFEGLSQRTFERLGFDKDREFFQRKADQPFNERVRQASMESAAFTQYQLIRDRAQAELANKIAIERLDIARQEGHISDKNYDKAKTAEDNLLEARIKNAEFNRKIQLETASNAATATRERADVVATRIQSGDFAAQLQSIEKQRDAKLRLLEIERQRAERAGDTRMLSVISNEVENTNRLSASNLELLEIQEKRAVTLIKAKAAATSGFAATVAGGALGEEIRAAEFAERRLSIEEEIARIKSMPNDARQQAELATANAALAKAVEMEKMRVFLVKEEANLRVAAGRSAVEELQLQFQHQARLAEQKRDDTQTAERIRRIELQRGPRMEEEIQNERDMAAARRAIRERNLNEAKQFMNAETEIAERVNTGVLTPLQGKLAQIRERTRQSIIRNPEMKAELERQGAAEQVTAIRENMDLKAVDTFQANLLAFQGRRAVAGKIGEKTLAEYSADSSGNTWRTGQMGESNKGEKQLMEKQLSELEKISMNTKNQVARYG